MSYQDKTLTCVDCGTQFTFGANEQEFYASRGLTNEPKRCPSCRQARKEARGEYGRGGYGRSNGGYGDSSYSSGGGRRGGRSSYSSGPRQMYPAVCAQCGKETEVPFQPRGDRPVYCSDCYNQQRNSY